MSTDGKTVDVLITLARWKQRIDSVYGIMELPSGLLYGNVVSVSWWPSL